MSDPSMRAKRPLSPHLQIYKPQMTSMLSILHRATGVSLAIGTLMVAWWLIAAATGPEAYDTAMMFVSSPIGLLLIAGWSFALYYHMLNGMRHLIWDTGRLLEIGCATKAGYCVFFGSIICTGATWFCAWTF